MIEQNYDLFNFVMVVMVKALLRKQHPTLKAP